MPLDMRGGWGGIAVRLSAKVFIYTKSDRPAVSDANHDIVAQGKPFLEWSSACPTASTVTFTICSTLNSLARRPVPDLRQVVSDPDLCPFQCSALNRYDGVS